MQIELYSGGVIVSSHSEEAQKSGVWKTVVRGPAPVPYVGVAVLGSYDVSASVGVGIGVILDPHCGGPFRGDDRR
jgi:hypothetical protein